MKINLRESLNKIDLATDNKYDLLNTFDSKKLSDNSKKKLAEAIDNNSIASINRVLHESSEQLYKVVISSGATKRNFESALYEDEAEGIVDYYGGRWIDENGFEWNMYVEEDDDSTEHAMVDNSYDMEDDDERAQREMDAYDQSDRDWEYVESLNESNSSVTIGTMTLDHEIPNWTNYAESPKYDENVTALPSTSSVTIYPYNSKELGHSAYWGFKAIDADGNKDFARMNTYIYDLGKYLDGYKGMTLKLNSNWEWSDKYPYLIFKGKNMFEDLTEDTVKTKSGKWVNKGSEGTHGKFRTKKAADVQRKAMFANGYKAESLNEQKYSSGNYFLTVDETGMGPHYSLYYQHPHSDYDGLMFIVDGYGDDNFKEKLSKFSTVYPNKDVQNLLKSINGYKAESLKEDYDDEYESDFDDNEVEEGNHVFEDGEEYVWVERIAGPIYLDFDKWAVWSAKVFVDPRDFMTIHSDGKNYDFDGDAFKEKAMAAPIVYFVVEEDTGFIDWGPVESRIEAQDFLNGKQEDWDNDEYYGESLEKNLDEWYVHTIHYEDIGDGREYDYEVDHEEVLDYLSEIAIDEEDAPEDTEEYLKWVEDNFDELFNKYEYEIEEHFREDASQEEYDRRHSSYES